MLKYIPHQDNGHSWRTLLFIFLVVSVSAGVAYFTIKKTNSNTVLEIESTSPILETAKASLASEENGPSGDIVVVSDQKDETVIDNPKEALLEAKALVEKPKIDRNKDPATKLDEARLYTHPQILMGKYIDISLRYQNMVIFEDGKVLDAYVISSGKKGLETPTGTFKIENKSPRAWSKSYGLWMPNWMAILPTGKIGIHELPVWPGGYQEGANHLGIPVSHGCVRLGVGAAKRVYDWVDTGTPVIIHK